jgi:regulator of RNase E activity RraA
VELLLAGDALGEIELPADFIRRIEQGDVVRVPPRASRRRGPAGPAPTTAIRLRRCAGRITTSVSRQARALTRHEVSGG